ncbi:M56 family metallopeptidase [Nocardia terpenica]|uniref:Peptidase M48 domain-containing protein n=1 Tax=Nocardia terpenica TaxID=455432 RepID=A0A164P825_9NOCA|nr:M56 family metallopeptidase [Nocardia terpenica]KZM75240.1 hypothetical protein AWN90_17665 [Nocardia terpenica]NQE85673.1 M56 family metallopeptidase [Nocardia terpenica]
MSAALGLFVFATVVAVCAPRVLPRLTRHGVAPRLGVAAWSTLIVSALGCWAVAAGLALADATHSWLRPERLMAEGLHEAEVIATGHAGLAAELALVAVTAALVAGIAMLGVRLARLLRRMRLRSRDHAEALRLTGRRVQRHDVGEVVVVDTPERAAYCVAGEPNVVVVTSAALAALEDRELAAVLAHEHAHLARHHPLLLAVTRGLAATFPRLRLCTVGAREIARLLEMSADDAAVRTHGRVPLLSGLLAMSGTVPSNALGASGTDILARARRLAAPDPGPHYRTRAGLLTGIGIAVTGPALVTTAAATELWLCLT